MIEAIPMTPEELDAAERDVRELGALDRAGGGPALLGGD